MQNGITYIVRPCIQPSNNLPKVFLISEGSAQLFVGPASSFFSLQINVRSSTRATSDGSDQAK